MLEDEGYELAKALLMMHQRLYAPVWWDHPPMHPGILQAGSALFGSTLQAFRLVAGLLCAASLWALAACASPGRWRGFAPKTPLTPSLSPPRRRGEGARRAGEGCGPVGFLAPLVAVLLCVSSVGFLSYGLSVTIMLPALGFALWAVWLWQRFGLSGNRWVLFGSGIVFGLGFQTKFTVLLFLPALAVEFLRQAWVASRRRGDESLTNAEAGQRLLTSSPTGAVGVRQKVSRALGFLGQWSGIWLAGFVYGVAFVWAFFPEEDLVWLLKYHFRPEVTAAFEAQAGWSPMLHKLGMDWPIASFAVVGLFLGLVQRRWAVVFPTLYFATSFLAHAWHRPWWDYYYLHLSIPMAWLGALGMQWTWDTLTRPAAVGSAPAPGAVARALAGNPTADANEAADQGAEATAGGRGRPPEHPGRMRSPESASLRRRLWEFWPGWKPAGLIAAFSFCLAGFLVELPERYERETACLRVKASPTEEKILAQLKERRADTRWLYTDRPIWSAHANILIPPELVILTLKRIAAKDITHAEFLRLLYHYRPEQIVLQRRHFEDEKFHEFLRAFYDVLIEEGNLKYLVRRDWEAARKARLVPNPKVG